MNVLPVGVGKLSRNRTVAVSRGVAGDERFAQVFQALGEPNRLRMMQILPQQPVCREMYNVIELAEALGLTQPTVSHHLKILRRVGLVDSRRQCNSVYFYVNQANVHKWLQQVQRRFGCSLQRPADAVARGRPTGRG
ncbi:MAG: helix-turn-helix transcriptional regulator [Phycisphaerales bacterium]|nr:helix-turn-helix transcriptional regulator [Phycisphaerales bacterium]